MNRPLVALVLAIPLSCSPTETDFNGLWSMTETDATCQHSYSRCFVQIVQQGDRAMIYSWGGDGWTCTGRGAIEATHLRFRWGGGKDWHGTADLERTGGELHGTYHRDEANAAVQYCRGVFVRAVPEDPSIRGNITP